MEVMTSKKLYLSFRTWSVLRCVGIVVRIYLKYNNNMGHGPACHMCKGRVHYTACTETNYIEQSPFREANQEILSISYNCLIGVIFFCGLFYSAVSILDYVSLEGWMIVKMNWKRHGSKQSWLNWGTSQHLLGGTEENHINLMMVSWLKFEPSTSWIKVLEHYCYTDLLCGPYSEPG